MNEIVGQSDYKGFSLYSKLKVHIGACLPQFQVVDHCFL